MNIRERVLVISRTDITIDDYVIVIVTIINESELRVNIP